MTTNSQTRNEIYALLKSLRKYTCSKFMEKEVGNTLLKSMMGQDSANLTPLKRVIYDPSLLLQYIT